MPPFARPQLALTPQAANFRNLLQLLSHVVLEDRRESEEYHYTIRVLNYSKTILQLSHIKLARLTGKSRDRLDGVVVVVKVKLVVLHQFFTG
jgi:hypothetical protein